MPTVHGRLSVVSSNYDFFYSFTNIFETIEKEIDVNIKYRMLLCVYYDSVIRNLRKKIHQNVSFSLEMISRHSIIEHKMSFRIRHFPNVSQF